MTATSAPKRDALAQIPKDHELPYSDGVPIDTPWHRDAINLLIDSLKSHRRGRQDYFCGGDMFLYFSAEHVFNKDFRGPDFFVVDGVDLHRPRLSWVVWQEGGRFPNVIVELSSPSTADIDAGPKRALYRDVFRTPEYFIYDPLTGTFDGYQRRDDPSARLEVTAENRVWSRELNLYLGTWDGLYQNTVGRWVRFFTADGALVPTFYEAAQAGADAAQAELARLKAELAALKASPPPSPPSNP